MTKTIFVVLTMFVLASNVFSRDLNSITQQVLGHCNEWDTDCSLNLNFNEQEFRRQYEIEAVKEFIRDAGEIGFFGFGRDASDFNAARSISNMNERLRQLHIIRNRILGRCRSQDTPQCVREREVTAEADKQYRSNMANINAEWRKYRAEVAMERMKGQFARNKSNYRDEHFASYDSIVSAIRRVGFKTTNECDERSEEIFKRVVLLTYQRLDNSFSRHLAVRFGGYNTNRGELMVFFDGDSGIVRVSPAVAQKLQDKGNSWQNSRNNIDYTYDYFFFHNYRPVFRNLRIGIKGSAEMYNVSLSTDNISDNSAFRGSKLWSDNPCAKNLIITYKEIPEELKAQAEKERKRRQEEWERQQELQREEQARQAEIAAEQRRIQEAQRRIEMQRRAEIEVKQAEQRRVEMKIASKSFLYFSGGHSITDQRDGYWDENNINVTVYTHAYFLDAGAILGFAPRGGGLWLIGNFTHGKDMMGGGIFTGWGTRRSRIFNAAAGMNLGYWHSSYSGFKSRMFEIVPYDAKTTTLFGFESRWLAGREPIFFMANVSLLPGGVKIGKLSEGIRRNGASVIEYKYGLAFKF